MILKKTIILKSKILSLNKRESNLPLIARIDMKNLEKETEEYLRNCSESPLARKYIIFDEQPKERKILKKRKKY